MDLNYTDAKDFKDINYNLKLLVQKYNHEHTAMVKDIGKIKKDNSATNKDVGFLKTSITKIEGYAKGMKTMLTILLSILGAIGALVGLGVAFS